MDMDLVAGGMRLFSLILLWTIIIAFAVLCTATGMVCLLCGADIVLGYVQILPNVPFNEGALFWTLVPAGLLLIPAGVALPFVVKHQLSHT